MTSATLLTGAAVLAAGAVGLEAAARLAFRRRHQEPFRPRPIIEYPYRDFIESVDGPLIFRFKPNFAHSSHSHQSARFTRPRPRPEAT